MAKKKTELILVRLTNKQNQRVSQEAKIAKVSRSALVGKTLESTRVVKKPNNLDIKYPVKDTKVVGFAVTKEQKAKINLLAEVWGTTQKQILYRLIDNFNRQ